MLNTIIKTNLLGLTYSTGLTFGFVPNSYTVNEVQQEVVFNVFLISGTLTREVVIRFFTEDGSAACKIQLCNFH